jgi:NAD(P)-dependent dehydrogenase (short-subunit alcohol dehydrogenase family)
MKTVIITGSNGNLGSAVTRHFLQKNYRVVATVSNEEAKKEFASTENLDVQAVNLTNEEETEKFITAVISKYKQIDAALLLVGGFAMGNFAVTKGADIKNQITLNFETAYYVARPLLEHMVKNDNGRLIFIGSRPALKPADGKNMVAYGLSKSLIFKLAEYINAETKGANVTASVVVPSTLDTPLNRKNMPDVNPGKWVKPEALAEILEFLCSESSSALRETVLKVYNNG